MALAHPNGGTSRRLVVAAGPVLTGLALSALWLHRERPRHPGDWPLFVAAVRNRHGLPGRHLLHLYAATWQVHFGPLSLPFGLLPSSPAQAWPAAVALLLLVPAAAALAATRPSRRLFVIAGCALVPVWLDAGVIWSHVDVLLPCVLALAATAALVRGRSLLAGVLLGLALGASLTAVFFLPLLCLPTSWRARLRAMAAAGAVGLLAWLPFLAAAPVATLTAMRADDRTWRDSVWHFVWTYAWPSHTVHPVSLPRTAQAVACLVGMLCVGRRRGIGPALVAGAVVRIALDSLPGGYQLVGLVTAGIVADVLAGGGSPRWTVVTFFAALAPVATAIDPLRAVDRVLCAGVVLALLLRSREPADGGPVDGGPADGVPVEPVPSQRSLPSTAGREPMIAGT